jgi:eukaryotic-like serine/threonine-protein kinase
MPTEERTATRSFPDRIGPYRITRVLGQGGMGTVYEAEQLEPLRRTVALKVIRLGMDTDEVLARFESERQALAVMDHPNIARALEAGTTDEGLPYFVMELVAGEPITAYCDRHGLGVRQRLQLFLGVCRGVQHAHQKGVIHRDLKPSNILVRVTDGQPIATIIDFGIAKATEHRLTDSDFTTELGVAVGTPAYMSPEQAEASGLDIDTRSDIYSLGMVLYELMTGVLPFDQQGLLPAAFIAQYVLGHPDVPTPSRRVATLESETATNAARRRATTPVGLRRELRGDIDWIVVKAIERDRNRRYETVNGLALDLERHLESKPVSARPPTLGYTMARFVRRHRLGVSVLATAAVALVVGVTSIMRERDRAARGEAKALAISGFLVDLFKSADPWQGGARQTTVVDALAQGVKQVNAGRIADPVIASSLRRTIGTVYQGLGRNAEADSLYRQTLRERLARTGAGSEESAQSWNDLGALLTSEGKLDSAETALRRALEIRRRSGADTLLAGTLLDLADLMTTKGQLARSDTLAEEALRIYRKVAGERHLAVAAAMARVLSIQGTAGEFAKAESTGRAAVAMLRELGLERHPQMVPILSDLSIVLARRSEFTEALSIGRRTVSLDSSLFGTSHPYLATHLENLGYVYDQAGFGDSAMLMVKQVLAMRRAVLADDNPAIGRTLFNLASLEHDAGSYRAAEPHYEEALMRMRRAYGPEHPDVVYATGWLGRNQFYLGRRAEAERNIRWVMSVTDPNAVSANDTVRFGRFLVTMLVDQRRWRDAEPLALRVFAIQDSTQDSLARVTAGQLGAIYEGIGERERAEQWRGRVGVGR